jgi:hypothetical protein
MQSILYPLLHSYSPPSLLGSGLSIHLLNKRRTIRQTIRKKKRKKEEQEKEGGGEDEEEKEEEEGEREAGRGGEEEEEEAERMGLIGVQ